MVCANVGYHQVSQRLLSKRSMLALERAYIDPPLFRQRIRRGALKHAPTRRLQILGARLLPNRRVDFGVEWRTCALQTCTFGA